LHQPLLSNVRRARFTPEEVVKLTLEFYRRNYIEGLFLSSGIIRSSDYTMEQIVRGRAELRRIMAFAAISTSRPSPRPRRR
jgi:predicted DNA-binding helix-hairpin-helix protein